MHTNWTHSNLDLTMSCQNQLTAGYCLWEAPAVARAAMKPAWRKCIDIEDYVSQLEQRTGQEIIIKGCSGARYNTRACRIN